MSEQLYKFTKIHWTVYLKWVIFMIHNYTIIKLSEKNE